ncbi:MAG: RidA family protein [candidate division KSB1 bacterium]|nr:RidA family protein [candidate division KSB1 bacterium]
MKNIVSTPNAPGAIGPYSQGVITSASALIYTAGQIPIDPATGEMKNDTIEEATEQVLRNVEAILTAAGASMDDVIKITVFMTDLSEFAAMNEVYARFFGSNPPSRSAVQVAALPKGARIEIEAIAAVRK